ncbi:helix-turn-helix domain-containing protein [Brachybacterium huguangmaarense]|uniref:Helix-turn-helix domain-containing protein n=1 Tax=Brachybacterium huguangmaarense TaxID=1652028 RepID=A0ABY6FZ77_9MICO|nr:helix-turn-helix domain-containing protein [Brachybacterium huguangmaarense]UYG16225.1 helix-turn-helix domain-containing protein [Brachybacterium huguangmaarense]
MTSNDDVREFLVSRRAQITPARAGLPDLDEERRVPGLRREEVAALAGVSVGYYTRLERGHLAGASESVLGAIARALQLTEIEREYLFGLARSGTTATPSATRASAPAAPTPAPSSALRSSLTRLVDSIGVPAIVQTPRLDLVAANTLGRALFAPVFEDPRGANFARFNYLDPRARDFYVDWPLARRTGAAILRLEAGRNPLDEALTDLIGELSTLSPHFREDRARRDVHEHRTGVKHFRHPQVGRLDMAFEVLETPGDPSRRLVTYSADPGTETARRLGRLGTAASPPTSPPEPPEPSRQENP